MALTWTREENPMWDADKQRIVGGAPDGAFDLPRYTGGGTLPGEWWCVREQQRVRGYGWMDVVWGDAEILLAVEPTGQGAGVGTFILDNLAKEAASRGIRRMFNRVRPEHAKGAQVTVWLLRHGFHRVSGGDDLEKPIP